MQSIGMHMKEETLLNHLNQVLRQMVKQNRNYSHLHLTIQTLTKKMPSEMVNGQAADH